MRVRNWVLIAVAVLALGAAGCTARVAQVSRNTPIPTKTLRPTFTATLEKPTLTPTPPPADNGAAQPAADQGGAAAAPTAEPATPTAEPTAEPSPTPEPAAAAFTVTSSSLNVRSGPGTLFPVIGRLTNGQNFPITGKNNDGSWWQFDYNGQTGWVVGSNVAVTSGEAVQVAQNIPAAPPTARPQPTARPAAPRPTAAPQPAAQPAQPQASIKFGLTKSELRPNTNPYVSVWCFVLNPAGNGLVPGTIRVLQGGTVVGSRAFSAVMSRGDSGYPSQYLYNDGCKVELPAADGTYTAYLVEGDTQVSEPFNFTVSGQANRTAIIEWKQR